MRSPALVVALQRWFDSGAGDVAIDDGDPMRVDWVRILPLLAIHLSCLTVVWVRWSTVAVGVAFALYVVRMFAISAFYHRYFAHRAFKTSRRAQLVFAILGASAMQRGALWWSAHHRHHHAHADEPVDIHSPRQHGLLWSHMGWLTSRGAFRTNLAAVQDFATFPELRFLDRFDTLVPFVLGVLLFVLGSVLAAVAPELGTNGWQMLVWGFCISSTVLLHVLCATNSYLHTVGYKSYDTGDDSTNSLLFSCITLGEGWHNNHHRYPSVARLGHRWWEIDPTHRLLRVLERVGIVWDLRALPTRSAAAVRRPDGPLPGAPRAA